MPRIPTLLNLLALSILGGIAPARAAEAAAGPVTLQEHIKPVLQKYCFDCHNPDKQKGDVNLVGIADNPKLLENREVWSKVMESIEKGDMPPEKKPQPSSDQKELVVHFLDGQLSQLNCALERNPGRVTLRRLNKEEYRNTIRDLLKVNYSPDDFPNDEVGYGFDNIADVLSLSPMLMEKYLAAADDIAGRAIVANPKNGAVKKAKGNEFWPTSAGAKREDNGSVVFASNAEAQHYFELPQKGPYTIRVLASADKAGPALPKLRLTADGRELGVVEVSAEAHKPAVYTVKAQLEKGGQKVFLGFINDYYDDKNVDPKLRGDSNIYVESVEIEGPPAEASWSESQRMLVPKLPEPGTEKAAARALLAPFIKRAYRRPVTEAEVERIAQFVDLGMAHGSNFLEGMQVAVQAVLCSPQFLFRWELDPPKAKPGEVRDLSDYEVACRLSYFLWNSMPDAELFALADKGELRKDNNLEKQVTRMMRDWRSRAMVNSFADQWLQIRNIFEISIDPKLFPRWEDSVRFSMKEETERFFEAVMKEDRPVQDLLDANFTFVNEQLAKYYDIPGVKGPEFRRVEFPAGSPRGGVITQAAVLLATSTPTRTSPVIRGKWVLEQILGTPPPAPPADVPPLNEQSTVNQTAPLRVRLSQHSQREECAGCHKRMDPLGFALENFDATGVWREMDGKFPIDASGKLPDGQKFNGPAELKGILKSGSAFANTFAEKMMTYALGRGLDYADRCAVRDVVEKAKQQNYRFSALVTAIVTSDPFVKRKTADALTAN